MSSQAWRRLAGQYRAAIEGSIEDVGVLDDASGSLRTVQAVIFGPLGTPYASGAFRLSLQYSDAYPTEPPAAFFATRIFHPNIGPRGEVCVNTLKRDWSPAVTIAHILAIVKCLLIEPGPDSALNEDAGKLLMDDYAAFAKHAGMYADVHALTVQQGLALLPAERRAEQKLSCRPDVAQSDTASTQEGKVAKQVLGQSAKLNDATSKAADEPAASKAKLDTAAIAKKKDADARKKSLRRL